MKIIFLACATFLFCSCAVTPPPHSTSSHTLKVLPIAENGEVPYRFSSAARAIDPINHLAFSKNRGTIGKLTFSLSDSQYSQFDKFVVKYPQNEESAFRMCAVINGKTVVAKADSTHAVFISAPFLWQGENTIILNGVDNITQASLEGQNQFIAFTDQDWTYAPAFVGITNEWFLPKAERKERHTFLSNLFLFLFTSKAISPIERAQWVDVALNTSRPLTDRMLVNGQPLFKTQDRLGATKVSSEMILTSMAVWYALDFEISNTDSANTKKYFLAFEKLGAGALWFNGERIDAFPSPAKCKEIELKNIRFNQKNSIIFILLPAQQDNMGGSEGAILEAVELRQR